MLSPKEEWTKNYDLVFGILSKVIDVDSASKLATIYAEDCIVDQLGTAIDMAEYQLTDR